MGREVTGDATSQAGMMPTARCALSNAAGADHTVGMKQWWLDELAYAGQEHLDAAYVAGYERKAGFDPSEDVAALTAAGLNANSVVLDLGAGSGVFAVAVAPLCRRVIAIDVSPAMLAYMRDKVARLGIKNVEVIRGGFLSYEHVGEPVDFVYTRNALHQVPDFWKGIALDRMWKVLKPGGILRLRDLVFDFEPRDADVRIGAWMAGAVDDSAKGWTAAELAEHVRIEFSTYSWVFEPMLERTGFEIFERGYARGAYGTYTCRRE
jgi:ubiquinone/menaquinone biosynthesis C-methylase UbiE